MTTTHYMPSKAYLLLSTTYYITTPLAPQPPLQPFYCPFSSTTWVSQCQKRTSGLYGAKFLCAKNCCCWML